MATPEKLIFQNKLIEPSIALFIIVVISGYIVAQVYIEYYRAFSAGLAFEETILLKLGNEQTKKMREINAEFFKEVEQAFYEDISEQEFQSELRLLILRRNEKINDMLNHRQRTVWEEMQKNKRLH